jgi:hypothetical protein
LNTEDAQEQKVAGGLRKVLNRHGYGFHYSVLQRAASLHEERRSKWMFEVAELPVEVQGAGTRIDFILRERTRRLYLLAECKRANPALSNWCFVRAPYYRRNQEEGRVVVEEARASLGGEVFTRTSTLTSTKKLYHLGLEVRSGEKGDPSGSGRGAIEEAATQVCRGLSGMVNFLSAHPQILQFDQRDAFLPVIFTTARIWTSEVDLGSADLQTGELELGTTAVTEEPWIWFQYHLSPGLKHSISADEVPTELGDILDLKYVRTIAVVNSSGIENFLVQEW